MPGNKRVLMLGWEFPPVFSGGLGIVTKNLIAGLDARGADVTLALPQFITHQIIDCEENNHKFLTFKDKVIPNFKTIKVPTLMNSPYITKEGYEALFTDYHTEIAQKPDKNTTVYGEDLFMEIERFALEVMALTETEHFDLVHAHDWITAETAIQLKIHRNIPFVLHIHATEIDRTGTISPDSEVYRRECHAMAMADRVIAVSKYTKQILVEHYGIPADKISVVHNAYEVPSTKTEAEKGALWKKDKSEFWVLFIGRVTLQKGPEYFVETAAKVVPHDAKVHFLIAGSGDMLPAIQKKIKNYDLEANVHCLGFVNPEQRDALYMYADACIIPSVSEPFGLTAIEVIDNCTPLIISKNCGANEIIGHKLEVDFWDSDKMAEYVLALKRYPHLRRTLREKAIEHRTRLNWEAQAARVMEIYDKVN